MNSIEFKSTEVCKTKLFALMQDARRPKVLGVVKNHQELKIPPSYIICNPCDVGGASQLVAVDSIDRPNRCAVEFKGLSIDDLLQKYGHTVLCHYFNQYKGLSCQFLKANGFHRFDQDGAPQLALVAEGIVFTRPQVRAASGLRTSGKLLFNRGEKFRLDSRIRLSAAPFLMLAACQALAQPLASLHSFPIFDLQILGLTDAQNEYLEDWIPAMFGGSSLSFDPETVEEEDIQRAASRMPFLPLVFGGHLVNPIRQELELSLKRSACLFVGGARYTRTYLPHCASSDQAHSVPMVAIAVNDAYGLFSLDAVTDPSRLVKRIGKNMAYPERSMVRDFAAHAMGYETEIWDQLRSSKDGFWDVAGVCQSLTARLSSGYGSEIWVYIDRLLEDGCDRDALERRVEEIKDSLFDQPGILPLGVHPSACIDQVQTALAVAALAGELAIQYGVIAGVQGDPTAAIKYCLGLRASQSGGATP
ncbi:MAG: hypothetical protein V4795_18815 [Pseudomonadota bacterium]